MAQNKNRQYRPVCTARTAVDDALDVAAINDLADSVNNYQRWVARFKQLGQPCLPTSAWSSPGGGSTDEGVIQPFAPREFADGMTKLTWIMGHVRSAGADNTTWKLYCSARMYLGPDNPFDTDYLSPDYKSATITTSSGTHAIGIDQTLEIVRNFIDGLSWLILTGENADGATRCNCTTIDVWPNQL